MCVCALEKRSFDSICSIITIGKLVCSCSRRICVKKKNRHFLLWIIEKNDIKSFAIIDATFNFTSLLELLFFLCRSIVDEHKNLTNRDRGDGNVFL